MRIMISSEKPYPSIKYISCIDSTFDRVSLVINYKTSSTKLGQLV
jgi:hypothetical protein